jgi:hypothetical protein
MDEFNTDVGPNGQAIVYEVSEDEVGTVMDFEIAARESYTVVSQKQDTSKVHVQGD